MTDRVASGVTSRGAHPVPPVVITRSMPLPERSRSVVAMRSSSSATMTVAVIRAPSVRESSAATAGPDVSRLITEFMRQNRRHVWAERETMQRVISTCLNAPGTWARYALDGAKSF